MSDLIEREAVKEALRNRIGESIDECINNVPTVDVLEQIRVEIEQYNRQPNHYPCDMISIGTVLQIIDKYT